METNPKETAIAVQTAKVKSESTSLVEVRKNQVVTTSLEIAKHFGKLHKDVLRDIRELECSSDFVQRNFALYHYHSKLNENVIRKLPMYYITRDGFTFLAMGFTGKVAAKFKEDYINAFNEMEKSLLEIREKGLVSVKLLKDQKSLTEYWKGVANSNINNVIQMSKNIERLAEMVTDSRNATKDFRPKKFYKFTEEYFNIVVKSFGDWLYWENTGSFGSDIRDRKLVDKLEAARLLYFDYNKPIPPHIAFNLERR